MVLFPRIMIVAVGVLAHHYWVRRGFPQSAEIVSRPTPGARAVDAGAKGPQDPAIPRAEVLP